MIIIVMLIIHKLQIISSREFQKIHTQQQQALKRAADRRRQHERRRTMEKHGYDVRQKQAENKATDEESAFNKEKQALMMEVNITKTPLCTPNLKKK